MDNFKIWGWEKKKRTMIRFIKPGDIFCFQFNETVCCFGRILTRLKYGTIAEVFDYISNTPEITHADIAGSGRMFHPVNLDVYSLFDRKCILKLYLSAE
jgi:hypothetical protein